MYFHPCDNYVNSTTLFLLYDVKYNGIHKRSASVLEVVGLGGLLVCQ